MQWIEQIEEVRAAVVGFSQAGKSIGLVPTMGNLHAGHMSLIRRARSENDVVVVTIFVNPIQFVQGEDLEQYPRTPENDRKLCEEAGVDLIFAPNVEAMYRAGECTRVQVVGLEEPLCGGYRPGHFVGVATVVTKLFNIVPADVGYFGSKDYQQAKLIERLAGDLNFPIRIETCPTVRESDGLAMSSRNVYLSPEERQQAVELKRSLDWAHDCVRRGEEKSEYVRQGIIDRITKGTSGSIDYVEVLDAENLVPVESIQKPVLVALAVRFGKARLIDNIVVTPN